MVKALLITGETYTSRRQITSLGGKWNPEESGWLVPMEAEEEARTLAEAKRFACDVVDVEPVLLESPTGERLRAIRQSKIDRRNARKMAKAQRLDHQSRTMRKDIPDDPAFWEEPIKWDHYSAKSHASRRRKAVNKLDNSIRLSIEADELRSEVEHSGKARVAGDAEKARQAKRDHLDTHISVGSRVKDPCFGEGTVVRVYKKSYRVKYDRGFEHSRDKSCFKPL